MALMKAITPEWAQQEIQEQGGTDFGFEFRGAGRFRTAVFMQRGQLSLTLRLIPSRLFSFEEIGLPPIVKSLCRRPRGMFLVTGPTGSGKTTTLATRIDYVNEHFDKHIITIEDPVEYYHSHKKSMVNQREVGVDVPSFSEALRTAETGHLVFGTLHTTSAQGTITRIVDQFPVAQQEQIRIQLASSLIAVLCQQDAQWGTTYSTVWSEWAWPADTSTSARPTGTRSAPSGYCGCRAQMAPGWAATVLWSTRPTPCCSWFAGATGCCSTRSSTTATGTTARATWHS